MNAAAAAADVRDAAVKVRHRFPSHRAYFLSKVFTAVKQQMLNVRINQYQ